MLLARVGLRHTARLLLGAQTRRRGSVGPAGGSHGGKDPTGRIWNRVVSKLTRCSSGGLVEPAKDDRLVPYS